MKNVIKTIALLLMLVVAAVAFTGCQALNELRCLLIGHSIIFYNDAPPSCTEEGLSATAICEICGHVKMEGQPILPLGHLWKEATCTRPMTCERCGETLGEVLEHSMIKVEAKEPTCTESGYSEHLACENCDHTENKEIIAESGHSLKEVDGKSATCEEDGYSDHRACDFCEYTEDKAIIPASHTYGDPDANGSVICSVCGAIGVISFEGLEIALNEKREHVVLESDITVKYALTVIDSVIDGNGRSVKLLEGLAIDSALFTIKGSGSVIKEVVFDGIKAPSVISSSGADIELLGCVFNDCVTSSSLLDIEHSDVSISDCVFRGNTSEKIISFNSDDQTKIGSLCVENCNFEGNTCSGMAILDYSIGYECVIIGNTFRKNIIDTVQTNAATVFLDFSTGNTVINNLFFENSVIASASTSDRVSGGIFFGYDTVFEGNAFVGNRAENANGSANLGQNVCVSLFFTDVDISGNFWGDGQEPVKNSDYLVQHEEYEETSLILTDYATEMTEESDGTGVSVE